MVIGYVIPPFLSQNISERQQAVGGYFTTKGHTTHTLYDTLSIYIYVTPTLYTHTIKQILRKKHDEGRRGLCALINSAVLIFRYVNICLPCQWVNLHFYDIVPPHRLFHVARIIIMVHQLYLLFIFQSAPVTAACQINWLLYLRILSIFIHPW